MLTVIPLLLLDVVAAAAAAVLALLAAAGGVFDRAALQGCWRGLAIGLLLGGSCMG